MSALLAWLSGVPTALLYPLIAIAAFAENLFPPLPADSVIALGAFTAARAGGSALGAWSATMVGNLGGAAMMFLLGRRYGSAWLERRLPALGGPNAATRLSASYERHGLWSLALSRFIPAVRAVVPPFAGALGVGMGRAMIAMSLASAVWYGMITWVAYRVGGSAESVLSRVAASQRVLAGISVTALVVLLLVLWRRRNRL